jgi:DNA-binding PadR family transcriptional regulator
VNIRPEAIAAGLPLQPAAFQILVSLAAGDLHGYAILQDVEERSDGEAVLSAGTLYRNLQRMVEGGLIIEVARRPLAALDDARRRYYRATPLGLAAVRAEVARYAALVRQARARGLTPTPAES